MSVDGVGEVFESGFGDEGVDESGDEFEVVGVEFVEVVELGAEGVFGAGEGSSGCVVDE